MFFRFCLNSEQTWPLNGVVIKCSPFHPEITSSNLEKINNFECAIYRIIEKQQNFITLSAKKKKIWESVSWSVNWHTKESRYITEIIISTISTVQENCLCFDFRSSQWNREMYVLFICNYWVVTQLNILSLSASDVDHSFIKSVSYFFARYFLHVICYLCWF